MADSDSDIEVSYATITGNGTHVQSIKTAEIYDEEVVAQLELLDSEVADIEAQIAQLQRTRSQLVRERKAVYQSYFDDQSNAAASSSSSSKRGTDYTRSDFTWSKDLIVTAQRVFKIKAFRMCQEAVCNAALDGRDAVVVMPTGGGKSLCYQLPAIMNAGLTVVISPLIALMTDQVYHLREVGIECELLCSTVSREDTNSILRRVRTGESDPGTNGSSSKKRKLSSAPVSASSSLGANADGLKLLYVTPERIVKAKSLQSAIQKAHEQGRIAQFVIDEAHCCSQMGHDYRPDYIKLGLLRKLYPDVPIMCLTATCGPKVLKEILEIVGLAATTQPGNAAPRKTPYFTAPLYRANLRYSVLSRPAKTEEADTAICDWILEHHPGKCGIVYCFSRKDTSKMAEALRRLSKGVIRTAVYNAELLDTEKERVHQAWRRGEVQVVCATIAFGMGIDKPDVRFVIHACIPKSLDGYYQETGRAGRDGQPSDCVLFYRPPDAVRLASMIASEPTGQDKLYAMLSYSQSGDCRKLLFAKYFKDAFGDAVKCGACDNCQSPPEAVDVTKQVRSLLRVLNYIHANGGRVTQAVLVALAMGQKSGCFPLDSKTTATGKLDIKKLIGTKLASKDLLEAVVIQMLLKGYAEDLYRSSAYAINVYIKPGRFAGRADKETVTVVPPKKTKVNKRAKAASNSATRKGKSKAQSNSDDEINDDDDDDGDDDDDDDDDEVADMDDKEDAGADVDDDDNDDDYDIEDMIAAEAEGYGDGARYKKENLDQAGDEERLLLAELRRRRRKPTALLAEHVSGAGAATGSTHGDAIELDSD